MDALDCLILILKTAFLSVMLLQVVPSMLWIERRGAALMQNRLGPNRVGPWGIFQAFADVIKFLWKEDSAPGHVNKFYFLLAPAVALVPAFMTFSVIPFAGSIEFAGKVIHFQLANLNVGFLFILAISSLGVYGIMLGAWASNNKYAMLGGLRSASQMISYELALGLSLVGIVLVFSSVELGSIVSQQAGTWIELGSIKIPKWGIFVQPLGFLIFLICSYAETNRLPFDLPEGESEIIAGYHIEYGSMKFAMFMMAEYLNMTTVSGLIATLYFGGWQLLPLMGFLLKKTQEFFQMGPLMADCTRVFFEMSSFTLKLCFFMWLFVWVRWTLPRFRYDQVMELGWKVLLPLSLLNLFLTAFMVALGWI